MSTKEVTTNMEWNPKIISYLQIHLEAGPDLPRGPFWALARDGAARAWWPWGRDNISRRRDQVLLHFVALCRCAPFWPKRGMRADETIRVGATDTFICSKVRATHGMENRREQGTGPPILKGTSDEQLCHSHACS